jgi:hypothetical protein
VDVASMVIEEAAVSRDGSQAANLVLIAAGLAA